MMKKGRRPLQAVGVHRQGGFLQHAAALNDAFLRVNPRPDQLRVMHDKDLAEMRTLRDVPDPDDEVRSVRAPTLIALGDRDIVKLEHALELTRLIADARLLILPAGHGDYIGEAVMTRAEIGYPELTARLTTEFLAD